MFIGHHKLNNIKIILDYNKIQSLDFVKNVIDLEPLKKKLNSFGFYVSKIDGHNHKLLKSVIGKKTNKPHFVITDTIKGKGVKFMENSVLWHYKPPDNDQLNKAIKNL